MNTVKILFPLEPRHETTDVAKWEVWASNCGTYRIVRSVSLLSEGDSYFALVYAKRVVSRHKSLPAAFRALAKFHEEDAGEQIETNEESVLKKARKNGLDVLPKNTTIPEVKGKPMKVERKAALSLFHELKYSSCDGWTNETISQFLGMLKTMPYQTFLDKLAGKELTKDQEDFLRQNAIIKDPANVELLDQVLNGSHKGEFEVYTENMVEPSDKALQQDDWNDTESIEVEEELADGAEVESAEEPKKRRGRPKGSKIAETPKKTKATKNGNGKGGGKKHHIKPGTVIEREYKGKSYVVTASADGFSFKGKEYSSLTQVAKLITGYPSISGPVFFGLVESK